MADRSELVDAVERLAFSLIAVTATAIGSGGPGLEPTIRQWRLLVLLGETDAGYRLGEIAAHLGGSAPSASRLVRRLETRGLVTISPDPADRRGIRVGLSPAGRVVRTSVIETRRRLIADSLRDVRVSPSLARELSTVAHALEPRRSGTGG